MFCTLHPSAGVLAHAPLTIDPLSETKEIINVFSLHPNGYQLTAVLLTGNCIFYFCNSVSVSSVSLDIPRCLFRRIYIGKIPTQSWFTAMTYAVTMYGASPSRRSYWLQPIWSVLSRNGCTTRRNVVVNHRKLVQDASIRVGDITSKRSLKQLWVTLDDKRCP